MDSKVPLLSQQGAPHGRRVHEVASVAQSLCFFKLCGFFFLVESRLLHIRARASAGNLTRSIVSAHACNCPTALTPAYSLALDHFHISGLLT